ncbi:MAG: SufD family Fe-S cluster assembly protein [Methanomethylophilus sp.]|jgi:Fe-S cluster assembly protein SufD
MDTVSQDLSALRGGKVDEDTAVDVLSTEASSPRKAEPEWTVAPGKELDLTVADLADADADIAIKVVLGEGSRAIIKLASVCGAGSKKVFAVNVVHEAGRGYSRTTMAGINRGNGTLRFLGSSKIANGAHGCDTRQDGRITNLSLDSRSEVSPSLLIDDNEVKASHGAALGAYDPEAIYYMMSRGLSEDESKRLIIRGSIVPVIESFSRKDLIAKAEEALGGGVLD